MRSVSQDNNLTYVAGMKEKEFYADTYEMKKKFGTILLLLVIVGISLALLLAYYNYNPIKTLAEFVTGSRMSWVHFNENELELVKKHYNDAAEQNEILQHRIDMQGRIVSNQCLLKLLKGEDGSRDEMEYHLGCAQIIFDRRYYCVMTISFPNSGNPFGARGILFESFENIVQNDTSLYICESIGESDLYIIVNTNRPNIDEAVTDLVLEQCKRLRIENVYIGIGNVYDNPDNIRLSCIESIAALSHALPNHPQKIYYYSNDSQSGVKIPYGIVDHSLLIESIKRGNKDIAVAEFRRVVEQIGKSQCTLFEVQMNCYAILRSLINIATRMDITVDESVCESVYSFLSLIDFSNKILPLVEDICAKNQIVLNAREANTKKEIIDYININYCDFLISLDTISSLFNISKPGINLFLKNDTGYTFNQYISMLRLNEAKRLLRETDESINTVVKKIGYIDVATFIRKFKSAEGMTPGQYRQLNH